MGEKTPRQHLLELGRRAIQHCGDAMVARSEIGPGPFFDASHFPWVRRIERGAPRIRAELDRLLERRNRIPRFEEISADQKHLAKDGRWRTFFFFAYGHRSDRNCAACPVTSTLLETIPGMKTAFFSILEGPTRIPPHRGPFNGVIRYHLALKVPRDGGRCGIRVGGIEARWREGESLLFDDTFEHEAWNDTNEDRVVLFVDVARPLPAPYALLNEIILRGIGASPFVKDGIRNFERFGDSVPDLSRGGAGHSPARGVRGVR